MSTDKKNRPESLDYFLAGIAPVFIIGMIGSLVYFLIAVCYQGSFTQRLMWLLGLYTVAAVLIARIAIEQSRQLAFTYMAVLACATLFVTPQFFVVQGPMAVFSIPILIGLLVMIAVLADRITFDCTSMNEQVRSSGVGLLQSLGLVKSERRQFSGRPSSVPSDEEPTSEDVEAGSNSKKRRASNEHNPGVWILYFALLALPLFGLGQMLIRNADDQRWASTFLFFYLLSSLFLLVLIALLSLRKYLRERGVPMETTFALRWLAIGMLSVFAALCLLMLLPLPTQSFLAMDLPFQITSRDDLKANRWGWGKEGVEGNGPQAENGKPGEENAKGQPKDGKPNDSDKGNGKADDQAKAGKAPSKDGKPSDRGDPKSDPNGSPDGDSSGKPDKTKTKTKTDPAKEERPDEKPNEPEGNAERKQQQGEPKPGQQGQQQQAQQQRPEQQAQQPPNAPPSPALSIQWNLSALLRWLFLLILLIVAIVFGFAYRRELAQSFQRFIAWLRSLLSGASQSSSGLVSEGQPAIATVPYPPFRSFSNPFSDRSGWTGEQRISYLYKATMSWGYEHRVECRDDETPEEYMRRLFRRFPEQQEMFTALGMHYNRIAYARGKVSHAELKPMADLWQWLVSKTASVSNQ